MFIEEAVQRCGEKSSNRYISSMKRRNDSGMSVLGRNLWRLRRERGLRQEDLAKHTGVSRRMISHYENADYIPAHEFIVEAAKYLGVSTDELLGLLTGSPISEQLSRLRRLPKAKQDQAAARIAPIIDELESE